VQLLLLLLLLHLVVESVRTDSSVQVIQMIHVVVVNVVMRQHVARGMVVIAR
jgi:hypothetical protein